MTSNTESAFRSGLSSLGWGRQSDQLPPPTTASTSEGWGSRLRGMVPQGARDYLPIGAEEEDQGWFGIRLSRWDRLLVFGACILGAAVCFLVAFLMMPVLVLKPRKFVMLWTVGSLLFLSSFAALQGPISYLKHLFSGSRIPFTATYFTSMVLTIYFALGLQSTILTVVSAAVQVVCLVVYLVSYFPFGAGAIRWGGGIVARRVGIDF
ncbi:Protein transport protein sft2 [Saitoella coloradoensis]